MSINCNEIPRLVQNYYVVRHTDLTRPYKSYIYLQTNESVLLNMYERTHSLPGCRPSEQTQRRIEMSAARLAKRQQGFALNYEYQGQ